ncbi:MAG: alkaline phosphatase family protein [Actinomycetota bacterium]|nr:alkaline phosphatase family protein [Actinomycetota bacterium]
MDRRHTPVLIIGLVLTFLVAAAPSCGGGGGGTTTTTTTTTPTAPPSLAVPCGRTASPPTTYDHVVVMVEENRTWTGGRTPSVGLGFSPTAMPFLHGLATKCSYYTDWSETSGTQNSLNQYIGMTSGVASTSTVNDCSPSATCSSTDDNLFRQIRVKGGTPRSFVDGATTGCSVGTNVPRHIPALYYWGANDRSYCSAEVRPLSELDPAHLPTLSFVVPDLCNDGHDCSDTKVDAFAKPMLTSILNGSEYAKGKTLVVVVYDEDAPVPNLLIAPTAHAGPITSVAGSHASLLKSIELALGLPVMNQGQLPSAVDLRPSAHF